MTRLPARVDVAIVGAGQAGLSLSHCLRAAGIEHLLCERGDVAESWRAQRWNSFCLVTPNWTMRLAGRPYAGNDPHGFMGRDEIIERLCDYGAGAPVHRGVTVTSVARHGGGWQLGTGDGQRLAARRVVIATATHSAPAMPPLAHNRDDVFTLHASDYRAPEALPAGAVLVVGSGQSGTQIAQELHAAGREVYLATSRVGRLPRRYRGRDAIEWQALMGFLDRHASALDSPAHRFRPDPHLSGRGGGRTLDLRRFAEAGITLTGRLARLRGPVAEFAQDLADNLGFADRFAGNFERAVDGYIRGASLRAAPAPQAKGERTAPTGPARLQLGPGGVAVIVWATGFHFDFSWIDAPGVFDADGYPRQCAGLTAAPGLHFLGLNYVEHRRSGILYGAGVEATALTAVIAAGLGARFQAPGEA